LQPHEFNSINMEGYIMKRSIISLLTIVSLSLASVQAMEQNPKPDTVLSIEKAIEKFSDNDSAIQLSNWLNFTTEHHQFSGAYKNTSEILLKNSKKFGYMGRIIIELLNVILDLKKVYNNPYNISMKLATYLKKSYLQAQDPHFKSRYKRLIVAELYLDIPILKNALVIIALQNNTALDQKIFTSPGISEHYQAILNRFKTYHGLNNNQPLTANLTQLVSDGCTQIPAEHELTHLEQIEKSKKFSFGDMLCNKDYAFDDYIAHFSFKHKQALLSYMVTWLKTNIDFSQDKIFYIDFFNMQPEGYVKMAMRFLYSGANKGQLIDQLDINTIRNSLKSNQLGIDLSSCFNGNNDPLFAHLITFIELANPLYNCPHKSIFLDNNQLTSIPTEIGKLTALIRLDLNDNQLTKIPAVIGNLAALTILNLRKNQFDHIPTELDKLTALRGLDLSDNRLTIISAAIGNLTTLTHLNLLNNSLIIISAAIGNLTTLSYLNINNNYITANDVPRALRNQLGDGLRI